MVRSRDVRVVWGLLLVSTGVWAQGSGDLFQAARIIGGQAHQVRALGDLDGDGDRDLISVRVLNLGTLIVSSLLNDGQGGFTEGWSFNHTMTGNTSFGPPVHLAVGDFDQDGMDDFFLSFDGTVRLWRSLGAAGVTAGPSWVEPTVPLGLLARDFDLDGRVDLAVARDGELKIYRNDVSGFQFGSNVFVPFGTTYRLFSVDADGVGEREIGVGWTVTPQGGALGISLYHVNGVTLSAAQNINSTAVLNAPIEVVSGDVDGDGDEDMVVFAKDAYRVLRRTGPATFVQEPDSLGSPASHLVDLDGDGDLDAVGCTSDLLESPLAGAYPNLSPSTYRVLINSGNGTFGPSIAFQGFGAQRLVGVEDIDADGRLELIAGRSLYTVLGTGSPPFALGTSLVSPRDIVDIDRDGDLDVLAGPSSRVARNNGAGILSIVDAVWPAPPMGQTFGGPGIPGDFDGDGDTDLLVKLITGTTVDGMLRLDNAGGGSFVDGGPASAPGVDFSQAPAYNLYPFPFPASPNNSLVLDVDGDGDLDLLTRYTNGTSSIVSRLWMNSGQGVFSGGTQFFGFYATHVVDFDGDGLLDLIGNLHAGSPWGNIVAFLATAPGVFSGTPVDLAQSFYNLDHFAIGDVDGDGDPDLVAPIGYEYVWFENQGGVIVSTTVLPGTGAYSTGQAGHVVLRTHILDLDGDGFRDIVSGPLVTAVAGCKVNRGGLGATFDDVTEYVIVPLAFADLDGDGDLDPLATDRAAWNVRFHGAAAGSRLQYGAGIPGSGSITPTIGDVGPLRPNLPGELRVTGGLGGAAGLVVISLTPANTPIPHGTLYVELDLVIPVQLSGSPGAPGAGSWSLPWSLGPAISGTSFYHQAGFLDPGAVGGLSTTQALRATFGQ